MTDVPLSKLIFIFCLIFQIFVISGCSDSKPEILSAKGYVTFDYKDDKSLPEVKFSVFAETLGEVQRLDSICVKNPDTKFEWNIDRPLFFTADNRSWAGYSNFVCPEGVTVPVGIYRFAYVDAQGNEGSVDFYLSYDKKLLDTKMDSVESVLSDQKKEQIGIYSDQDVLLYFGDRKSNWTEDAGIFNNYKNASYYRIYWVDNGRSVYCAMPPVYKTAEEKNNIN